MVHEIENFFGVYLLYCTNPKYKGQTYIGFTVDPNRRVKQHNRGRKAGGAKRTSGRGPWEMVLIIHGFPNKISALRFEWAWQNPQTSRRLRHITKKKKNESRYECKLRIVSEMLRTGPWNRLPLTIRWLKQEYRKDFDADLQPPAHMPMAFGPVKSKKVDSPTKTQKAQQRGKDSYECCGEERDPHDDILTMPMTQSSQSRCYLCSQRLQADSSSLQCAIATCRAVSHTMCLAKHFLSKEPTQLIPVEGSCPKCKEQLLWGDLIRFKRGCYQNLKMGNEEFASDDEDQWGDLQSTQ